MQNRGKNKNKDKTASDATGMNGSFARMPFACVLCFVSSRVPYYAVCGGIDYTE